MPDLKEQVSIFKVAGTGASNSRFVDILHEQFTAEKGIQPATDESGGVDSESMYAAIEGGLRRNQRSTLHCYRNRIMTMQLYPNWWRKRFLEAETGLAMLVTAGLLVWWKYGTGAAVLNNLVHGKIVDKFMEH